jgi:hypothetical protein
MFHHLEMATQDYLRKLLNDSWIIDMHSYQHEQKKTNFIYQSRGQTKLML